MRREWESGVEAKIGSAMIILHGTVGLSAKWPSLFPVSCVLMSSHFL